MPVGSVSCNFLFLGSELPIQLPTAAYIWQDKPRSCHQCPAGLDPTTARPTDKPKGRLLS